jgi:predicted ATPase/DNA-binding CsgD family transcriptional regulator
LAEHRLVSVVGPGGCGKTRLAVEVGRRATAATSEDVCFVDLSGLAVPDLVPGFLLRALGVPESPGASPLDSVAAHLAERKLLVILDNCEHLVEACTYLASALARQCPGVRLLATTRERLGAPGEAVVDLGGLELPEPGSEGDENWLVSSEAGRLFVERARLARPDFSLQGDDAMTVASICERLDGAPLAIEMAAARVRLMSVRAIAEGLSDRFRLLIASTRAVPERQASLLASIEWSCALLSEAERQLLYRLSVFSSGFTFSGAEAVCAGGAVERDEVFALLASLVEKSLVQASPGADRLRLHETMRAYAAGALRATGTTTAVRDRHLGYFVDLVRRNEPKTRTSEVASARRELEPDLDNLRAALAWSVESSQFATGAALLSAMAHLLRYLGLDSESVALCQPFLAADLEPSLRAELLTLASTSSRQIDPPVSFRLAGELVSLGRSLGDGRIEAEGLARVAIVKMDAEPAEAAEAAAKAVRGAREAGQPLLEAAALLAQAWALNWSGRPVEALAAGEELLRVANAHDSPSYRVAARTVLSYAAKCVGRFERALEEADRNQSDERPLDKAGAAAGRAQVLALQGESGAAELASQAVTRVRAAGYTFYVAVLNRVLGCILILLGQEGEGYQVLEKATAKLESWGLFAICVEERALLAEVAIRRGDLVGARRHLAASSWRLPRVIEPAGAPVFSAEARLARAEGEAARAHGLACDGLSAAYEGGHLLRVIDLLELVAMTCADLGDHTEAARLLGAAESQRDLIGYVRPAPYQYELTPVAAEMRASLGAGAFEEALSEGRSLSVDEAVAYARRGRGSHSQARSGWESLTASELRVVTLVGQHLTNAEIAARLFLSTATVKGHLNRVFAKLGVTNRGQLAAAAHDHEVT